jgi:hypothetical protein
VAEGQPATEAAPEQVRLRRTRIARCSVGLDAQHTRSLVQQEEAEVAPEAAPEEAVPAADETAEAAAPEEAVPAADETAEAAAAAPEEAVPAADETAEAAAPEETAPAPEETEDAEAAETAEEAAEAEAEAEAEAAEASSADTGMVEVLFVIQPEGMTHTKLLPASRLTGDVLAELSSELHVPLGALSLRFNGQPLDSHASLESLGVAPLQLELMVAAAGGGGRMAALLDVEVDDGDGGPRRVIQVRCLTGPSAA